MDRQMETNERKDGGRPAMVLVSLSDDDLRKIAQMVGERLAVYQKEVLTSEEAMVYTGLSKHGLYNLTHRNEVAYSKPGGKQNYFRRADLDEWMVRNRYATADELQMKAVTYCMKHPL